MTIVHLVDGTYELFRAYFGAPKALRSDGREVGAARALMSMWVAFAARRKVTHMAFAFDYVIESFRNDLFAGYKTGDGMPPDLYSQFRWAERIAHALGYASWPMVDFEADDALAAGAARWADHPDVEQVRICSPDKDLAQCVRGAKVVCYDRFKDAVMDEAGVVEKFGVPPAAIPDYLALVGDAADGIPGIPRWGAKSAAAVLARWGSITAIPDDPKQWQVTVRGADALAASLRERREAAGLYRTLATLRSDVPLSESLDDLKWRGAYREEVEALCAELEDKVPKLTWRE